MFREYSGTRAITSPAPSMRGLKPNSASAVAHSSAAHHIPCPVDEGIETPPALPADAPPGLRDHIPCPVDEGIETPGSRLPAPGSHHIPCPVDEGIETATQRGRTTAYRMHHIPCPVDEGIETANNNPILPPICYNHIPCPVDEGIETYTQPRAGAVQRIRITSPAPSMRGLKPPDGGMYRKRRIHHHIPCPVDEGIETPACMRHTPARDRAITSPAPSMRGLKQRDEECRALVVSPRSHPLPRR